MKRENKRSRKERGRKIVKRDKGKQKRKDNGRNYNKSVITEISGNQLLGSRAAG
jgi:hypothetical protein